MAQRMTNVRTLIARIKMQTGVALLSLGTLCLGAVAEGSAAVFTDWEEPRAMSNLEGFEGAVRIQGLGHNVPAKVAYTYPNGAAGSIACQWDEKKLLASFSLSPEPEAGLGVFRYHVEALIGNERITSAERRIPMSYAEELDITGPAAVPLLYPLPDEAYQVRYIPCCNIYGGVTNALRSPVNPTGADDGLPGKLVSDFVVLEPDALSASTSGLYFEFTYDAEKVRDLGENGLALYEFDGKSAWTETLSYEINEKERKVRFHCPDGGAYVLGAK